jgi:hypothetical protein
LNFCLPSDLENLANETKFIQRNRKLGAVKFLELLFSQPASIAKNSLTSLSSRLEDSGLTISKQALDKKFNENAVDFLKQIYLLLFEAQSKQLFHPFSIQSTLNFRSLRILDGTSIKLPPAFQQVYPSTVGSGVKCQLEFDYLTGQLMYVEVQAGKAGDTASGMKRLETVQENDLILQDLGYFQFDLFKEVNARKAFYVSRARADTMFYVDHPEPRYHENGEIMKKYAHERLYLEEELKTIKRGETREYPKVYLGKHARFPTRLVVYRMTDQEQRQQEMRIKRRKQTKPGKVKQKSYEVSSISTYVTNFPSEVSVEEITGLYRYRWQIELVFKSWKTDMDVDYYRRMKLERWECHFYACLILLLLSMLITYQIRLYLWEEKGIILSEMIAMREISKRIWKVWQARDDLEQEVVMNNIIKILARIGRKNTKKPTQFTDQ